MAKGSGGIMLLGIGGAIAYFTRASWLPQAEAKLGINATGATGATGSSQTAPTTTTGSKPITASTAGSIPVGNQGCFGYIQSTDNSLIVTCPPGVSPPPANPPVNNCAAGFTLDAGGICTRYSDSYLLANLNSIPWTGLQDIPSEQINRIDPQILSMYATTTGVTAGTALAYMLGLGGTAPDGTIMNGSDGYAYQSLNGIYYKQGVSTMTTVNSPIGQRPGPIPGPQHPIYRKLAGTPAAGRNLTALARALPITNATLIMASSDPTIAAIVGRDPRAMLTAAQWNNYYTQATGIVQGIDLHPADMRGSLMSAEQYQARRAAAGLQTISNLGTLRPARRGAFPLGKLGYINQWVPPGNRTIYQIPGRGAVPAGRGGQIPPRGHLGLIHDGGGSHRWARSPFPRPDWWREYQGE